MSMSKVEVIQRCRVRITEAKQNAVQKLEEDFNAVLKFLGDEEIRVTKEALTNGKPSVEMTSQEVPVAEPTTEGKPDRE